MDMQNRPQRQMYDVSSLNIVCAKCDKEIKELPFEPSKKVDGTFGQIYCYECNKERRAGFQDRGRGRRF
jgi:ribosomal protein S27E